MNKRQRKKYTEYWGCTVRVNSLPKTCYNKKCPHHSKATSDDCKYTKCRFKINRPTMENDNNYNIWGMK